MVSTDDYLKLLTTKKIVEESFFPYKEETARRYFRARVFFVHTKKRNVENQSYKGSVVVRYYSLEKVKRDPQNLSVDDIGKMFYKASGPEDKFIVSRLKKKMTIDQIVDEFTAEIRKNYLF